jgi:hypothetical protein
MQSLDETQKKKVRDAIRSLQRARDLVWEIRNELVDGDGLNAYLKYPSELNEVRRNTFEAEADLRVASEKLGYRVEM